MPSTILYGNAQEQLLEFLKGKDVEQGVIIVDENTKMHCLPFLADLNNHQYDFKYIEIKSGEEYKTLETCQKIWGDMTNERLDRKAIVINLGGGVIGDMGGFCAATYKRGIEFIQIPTTLLSQVDASIGGKLGIDFDHYKNHIGVFKEPEAVIIDSRFLQTLDRRELRSGFAEVIKHALIADAPTWHFLKNEKPEITADWKEIVSHSINIKLRITTEDPLEKGLRKVLNFGHTLGHAVESYFLEKGKRILHGEAIAIGMIMESFISKENSFITDVELQEIENYLLSIYDHIRIPDEIIDDIITLTLNDKKNEHGLVMFSLLKQIGNANWNQPINDLLMKKAINHYNSLLN